jgi:hypothetical protein
VREGETEVKPTGFHRFRRVIHRGDSRAQLRKITSMNWIERRREPRRRRRRIPSRTVNATDGYSLRVVDRRRGCLRVDASSSEDAFIHLQNGVGVVVVNKWLSTILSKFYSRCNDAVAVVIRPSVMEPRRPNRHPSTGIRSRAAPHAGEATDRRRVTCRARLTKC